MLNEQGDRPHPDKKFMQAIDHQKLATSDKNILIPSLYNPLRICLNINNLDKINNKKLKTSMIIVTI